VRRKAIGTHVTDINMDGVETVEGAPASNEGLETEFGREAQRG
jgi:hypothetical protein